MAALHYLVTLGLLCSLSLLLHMVGQQEATLWNDVLSSLDLSLTLFPARHRAAGLLAIGRQ